MTDIASVVAAGPLSNLLGVAATGLLIGLGIGLIGYACGLLLTAARLPRTRSLAWTVTALDTARFLGSTPPIERGLLTTTGQVLVGLVAVPVRIFAVRQCRGLRQLQPEHAG